MAGSKDPAVFVLGDYLAAIIAVTELWDGASRAPDANVAEPSLGHLRVEVASDRHRN